MANKKLKTSSATATSLAGEALHVETVSIDADTVGLRWTVDDIDQLSRFIAIIAMGQADHAAKIIEDLEAASPAFTHSALIREAKRQLSIIGTTEDQREASKWRRDGFIFEAVSWVAARQVTGPRAYLKAPHIKSTTQGIDGLMIELAPSANEVTRATIFEDKCSEDPRIIFRDHVMKAFRDHHKNNRAPELVACAAALIKESGVEGTAAVKAAGRVLDLAYRAYRAAISIESQDDSTSRRARIFKGYAELGGINAHQRLGATFVVDGELRTFFEKLAAEVITVLDEFGEDAADV